jgi:hypothetical protein
MLEELNIRNYALIENVPSLSAAVSMSSPERRGRENPSSSDP